jgi:hypothetical protein
VPGLDGNLTTEELEAAKKWFLENAALQPCPICRNQNWSIGNMLVMAPKFSAGAFIIGPGYPLVVVFCGRCTFVRFHSAIAMGLLPPETPIPKGTNG